MVFRIEEGKDGRLAWHYFTLIMLFKIQALQVMCIHFR